jgi:hypothetical protein
VLLSQCTSGRAYQGDQDNDPADNSNCDSGTIGGQASTAGQSVRIAELQVFGSNVR